MYLVFGFFVFGESAKHKTLNTKYNIQFFGGDSKEVTPVPIPNTEVKLFCADGTAWETKWESRTLPEIFHQPGINHKLNVVIPGFLFQNYSDYKKKFRLITWGSGAVKEYFFVKQDPAYRLVASNRHLDGTNAELPMTTCLSAGWDVAVCRVKTLVTVCQ